MKLLTLNVHSQQFQDCAQRMTDGKGDEILFIDWRDNNAEQWEIITSSPDSVRLIVFDRYGTITPRAFEYFVNRDAILLEPVVRARFGFMFMPYYVDKIDLPLSTWDDTRPFDFGYKGNSLSSDTEVCLLKIIKLVSGVRIGVSTKHKLSEEKYDTLKEVMSFGNFSWSRFNGTIIAGNDDDYIRGVLPDITNHLKNGVVPLIYHKHKWFHSVFRNFMFFDHNDAKWYKNMYDTIPYGMMDELYKSIETYMPEMITENFVETIIELGKG